MGKNNADTRKTTIQNVNYLMGFAEQVALALQSLDLRVNELRSNFEQGSEKLDGRLDEQFADINEAIAKLTARVEALEQPWWRKLFSRRAWRS